MRRLRFKLYMLGAWWRLRRWRKHRDGCGCDPWGDFRDPAIQPEPKRKSR